VRLPGRTRNLADAEIRERYEPAKSVARLYTNRVAAIDKPREERA